MNNTLQQYEPNNEMFKYLILGVLFIVTGIYYAIITFDHMYKPDKMHFFVLGTLAIFAARFLKKASSYKR